MCTDPRLLSWGSWRRAGGGVVLCDWRGWLIWLSLIGPGLEAGPKTREADSLSADRSGLLAVVVVVWLPGLVAADCGSEFYCHIWPGGCPFVYSVSQ